MARLNGRVDGNQKQITKELRAAGCTVAILSNLGKGIPDILVGYGKRNYLVELKDPAQPKSKQKLTPDEVAFFETWKGGCLIATTTQQILDVIQADLVS